MLSDNPKIFKQAVDQIRSQVDVLNPPKDKFHIIIVPKSSYAFETLLEKYGLYNIVKLHPFQWMPIYLDEGLLSLELSDVFTSLFINQSLIVLPTLSKLLWQLSFVIGKPRFIFSLGQYSTAITEQYEQFCEDLGDTDKENCDISAVVIFDRNVDYTSALLTPGTYAALLHEVYNVKTGICEYKGTDINILDEKCNPIVEKQQVTFSLDSRIDSVYADIKNRYFTEVTAVLSDLTKKLKSEKGNSKEMALDEIKRYVQTQLQDIKTRKKCITNHLLAAESIISTLGHRYENMKMVEQNIMKNSDRSANVNYLEELLVTENDKYVTLRLFCLLAITQTLSESEIDSFLDKYFCQFGYCHVYYNLVKAGILPEPYEEQLGNLNIHSKIKIPRFSSNFFYSTTKNFKQVPADPDQVDLKHPTCPSYVFGGTYIPLVAQILTMLLNSVPIEEIKLKFESLGSIEIRNERGYPFQSRSILVYLIGGVTYAEIAACNLLEGLMGAKIYILSDKIISGNDLVAGMLSTCQKCLTGKII